MDTSNRTDPEPRNRHERRRLAAGHVSINDPATRLAYSIDGAAEAIDSSRSKIYEEIRAGKLKAKKLGARTIITAPALYDYLDALPDMAA
jgi:hypothetical protein